MRSTVVSTLLYAARRATPNDGDARTREARDDACGRWPCQPPPVPATEVPIRTPGMSGASSISRSSTRGIRWRRGLGRHPRGAPAASRARVPAGCGGGTSRTPSSRGASGSSRSSTRGMRWRRRSRTPGVVAPAACSRSSTRGMRWRRRVPDARYEWRQRASRARVPAGCGGGAVAGSSTWRSTSDGAAAQEHQHAIAEMDTTWTRWSSLIRS